MSEIALAELLDQLSEEKLAFIAESEFDVTISNLNVDATKRVLEACTQLNLTDTAYDEEGSEWTIESISNAFEPFRVSFQKPTTEGVLRLLTNAGFKTHLEAGHSAVRWEVARLSRPYRTLGRLYSGWGSTEDFIPAPETKNPRSLVREFSGQRIVCSDIRPWLLSDDFLEIPANSAFSLWANIAVFAILRALSDEIDSEDQSLKFKGPPRLSMALPEAGHDCLTPLGVPGFQALQQAGRWVFESKQEAEMRHILLATELARSGSNNSDALNCVKAQIASTLEAAKIAYQMALSDLSRDTLKAMADLRKAITEETAKVVDATRQIITALASALAVGLGLVMARFTIGTDPWLLIGVMVVVAAYVAANIASGWQFMSLQRGLRNDWRPRLYRFIPDDEYQRLVGAPAQRAERTLKAAAIIGGLAVAILTVVVIITALHMPGIVSNGTRPAAIQKSPPVTTQKTPPHPTKVQQPSAAPKQPPAPAPAKIPDAP